MLDSLPSVITSPITLSVITLLVTAYIFRAPLLALITPRPLDGFPSLADQSPLWGDGTRMGQYMKKHRAITGYFDEAARQMLKYSGNKNTRGLCQVMFGPTNGMRFIIVADHKLAEECLFRRTSDFDRAKQTLDIFSSLIGQAQLALPTATKWKHHRRTMGPSMTSKNLAMFTPGIEGQVDELVALWKRKMQVLGKGQYFDPRKDLVYATTDVIAVVAFGESLGCLHQAQLDVPRCKTSPDNDRIVDFPTPPPEVFSAIAYLLAELPQMSLVPRLNHIVNALKPGHRHHRAVLDAYLTRRLADGRARAASRPAEERFELADNALDLACRSQGTEDGLGDTELKDELLQFLIAGQETTAQVLTWGCKFLARKPDVQRRLHAEIVENGLADRRPEYSDLTADKVPYLEAVAHEMLRLAGVAGAVTRTAIRDTTLAGHKVPKGANIYVPLALMQTERQVDLGVENLGPEDDWQEDPSEFLPERWLHGGDGAFNAKAGPSSPFSIGQRSCFGKALALLDLKAIIVGISANFFLERVPDDMDGEGWYEVVTRQPNHVYVRPVAWSDVEA